jgi:hypothetical protein
VEGYEDVLLRNRTGEHELDSSGSGQVLSNMVKSFRYYKIRENFD